MGRRRLVLLAAALMAAPALSRDTVLHLPVASVADKAYSQGKLDPAIALYFAGQKTPAIAARLGDGVSNRKTSSVGKGDEEACRWAMLSAMMALQQDAKSHGANAVVGIVSYYKKNEFRSATEFECHAGGLMTGVALKGEYVRLGKR
ncbi:excinuclease ATPase subunit [Arenimonas sp.]|uniref:excinuclease ATPase subunit n=1 Tax=Arenimonas sp. TaxID=1872635 RepID=UPI0039E367AC